MNKEVRVGKATEPEVGKPNAFAALSAKEVKNCKSATEEV